MKFHKSTTKFLAFALSGAIALTSCTSATFIQSNPPGAKIYVDNELVGSTPYLHKDTKITGSVSAIRLEKEGYAPVFATLTRNEEVDVGALIGGLLVTIPLLWIMKYKPSRLYELQPTTGNLSASPTAQAPLKSKAERLRELKQVLDEGIITSAEYEKEKKRILEEND